MSKMYPFKLSDDFMLGTATSSTQIEGGDKNNTWYKWCEAGHISDYSSCISACDHWNRVEEDIEILKSLHIQTHRLSLEWSRIEPDEGIFSDEAIKHYRNEIQLLLDNNIKPLVTLHHFSEPLWFHDMGGWNSTENAEQFVKYVLYVVENLGDLVCEWVTFNEPNVYTTFGYLIGIFPPGRRNASEAFRVMEEMINTHVKVYNLIHEIRNKKEFQGKTIVGSAIHFRVFDGITYTGKVTARFVDYIFHELFVEGMTKGRLLFPLSRRKYKIKKGKYLDFFGINYYTRNIVEFVFDPSNYCYKFFNDKNLCKSDLGWDIYPKGIYRVCKKYYNKCKLPIYITENGISDRYDNRRSAFIVSHLIYLLKAIKEGIIIERYYHWTQMDNFEWNEGESAKFGLYHCNFNTQERTVRRSAKLYAQICMRKEVTNQMIEEFSIDLKDICVKPK